MHLRSHIRCMLGKNGRSKCASAKSGWQLAWRTLKWKFIRMAFARTIGHKERNLNTKKQKNYRRSMQYAFTTHWGGGRCQDHNRYSEFFGGFWKCPSTFPATRAISPIWSPNWILQSAFIHSFKTVFKHSAVKQSCCMSVGRACNPWWSETPATCDVGPLLHCRSERTLTPAMLDVVRV